MKIAISFPHPVLYNNNDDYINCEFSIDVIEKEEFDKENFKFTIQYTLSSERLNELVAQKKAEVLLRIECSDTSFRIKKEFSIGQNRISFNIKRNEISNILVIKGFIIAKEDINSFLFSEHNNEYFSIPFKVEEGELLAFEDGNKIYLDATELEKPISSIVNIAKNDENDDKISINFEKEKITIYLDNVTYNNYFRSRRKPELKKFLIGIVVLPAIIEAVNKLKNCSNEYSEKRWFRSINKKLESIGVTCETIEDYESVELANLLLGEIVNGSINSIFETFANEFSGMETEQLGGID